MTKNKNIEFMIGTDAEFSAFKGREHISIESDDGENETGTDGNGISLELRCSPSKCPLKVLENIHTSFVISLKKNKHFYDSHWVAGGYYRSYPTGAHLHIGLTQNQINFGQLANILDNYLGSLSLALEDRKAGKLRRRAGYGRKGDYRFAAHGGMEYRVLSSFLVSPQITAAILCLFKVICDSYVNQKDFVFRDFGFNSRDFQIVNREKVKEKFSEIWADIQKMRLYKEYKDYINIIKYLIENDLSWLSSTNMKESWGLVNFHSNIKQIKITYNNIWQKWADSIGEKLNKLIGRELPEVAAE